MPVFEFSVAAVPILIIFAAIMIFVVRCAIWYYLYDLKNLKNTHGEVLILVKLQAKPATLLKLALLHGCFSRFLNYTNGTKSRNAPHFCK